MRNKIVPYLLLVAIFCNTHATAQDKQLSENEITWNVLSAMPDDTLKVKKLIQLASQNSWSDIHS